MFNLSHLQYLLSVTRKLGMTRHDTGKFLWSYYSTRMPCTGFLRGRPAHVTIRPTFQQFIDTTQLRLAIRNNGFDYDVVDEIFARRCYDIRGGANRSTNNFRSRS